MTKYHTKQRALFIEFLQQHPDEPFSASQIAQALKDQKISISAVYRNLNALEQEGRVRRITKSGSREAYYQYAAAEHCKARLHLSCKSCGKTFHMGLPSAELLIRSVDQNEGFSIDKTHTIIYGLCAQCREVAQ